MTDLEQRLIALGEAIQFPSTPEMGSRVRSRLSASRPASFDARRLAIAAAILVVTIGALLAFPSTRDAIAGFFGLKGVRIERVPTQPTPTATAADPVAQRLALGRPVSLAEALASLPYQIVFPESLGPPDGVYLIEAPGRNAVALTWKPRADLPLAATSGVGALVIEFPGKPQADLMVKMLGPDATLESVRVGGKPGYWISGHPHEFFFLDPQGNPQLDTFRLAGNTLLWEQGSLTIRIESALNKDQSLRLANGTH